MQLNELLKVGEVIEVRGQKVKAGIYNDKNTTYLNYNGEIIKNICIGGYVNIRKGFLNIVGKVEGEYTREKDANSTYEVKTDNINRVIEISILGSIQNDVFIHGLVELPLIGNYIYVIEKQDLIKVLSFGKGPKLKLGYLIDNPDMAFNVNLQDLLCSHIGIFGNTGSGKSNTLARLYTEVFNYKKDDKKFSAKSTFIFFDFNGEYVNTFPNAKVFKLSTRNKKSDKYQIREDELFDLEFWSIVLEATDKTQKPFIKRTLTKYKGIQNDDFQITKKSLVNLIIHSQDHFQDLKYNIEEVFEILGLDCEYRNFLEKIQYHTKFRKFYTTGTSYSEYSRADWQINEYKIQEALFEDQNDDEPVNLKSYSKFTQFRLILNYNYCNELSKGYIAQHHIGPMLARADSKIEDLEKIFEIRGGVIDNNVLVISLVDVNTQMKKLIPMIVCKTKYDDKKSAKGAKKIDSTLHLIIDEAHNILSHMSTRESEEWKDYRLESFEEIIKEGRKFGTFLTIASQRPSDISDTIISQLHNYFIHRLVNEEDLRKIERTVSFIDKASNDMISILPPGGCLFSGIASCFPVLAQINILDEKFIPHSENVNICKLWNIK